MITKEEVSFDQVSVGVGKAGDEFPKLLVVIR